MKQIKTCKTCGYCEQLHERCHCDSYKMELYLCSAIDKPTLLNDTCELWKRKVAKKCDLSTERFDYIEETILYLIDNIEAHIDPFYDRK